MLYSISRGEYGCMQGNKREGKSLELGQIFGIRNRNMFYLRYTVFLKENTDVCKGPKAMINCDNQNTTE